MRARREAIGLCVIDLQDRLFPKIAGNQEILKQVEMAVRAFQRLQLPAIATEQYPKGLGSTVPPIGELVETVHEKTRFSASSFLKMGSQWVLVGIEAHVCVLQTALDLVERGDEVMVLRGAIGSRRESDCEVAVDEMRHSGVRVTSVESLLFELLGDAKTSEFQPISNLIK